jgi:thioredoxin reductase (NADPH)
MEDNKIYDVIIIGSGPAGYTAALYSSRAFLKTLVIAGPVIGGQLTTTTEIHNFAGFPGGTTGPTLVADMKKQAEKFGTEVIVDSVMSVRASKSQSVRESESQSVKASERQNVKGDRRQETGKTFLVAGQNKAYEGKSLIIATGASARRLGIASEEKFNGKGISYCATCDGFFFRGKNIAVLGGGDAAMEEATFLTKFASHVTIIHRREEFKASPIMLDRAKKDPQISFLLNNIVEEFYGDTRVKGIKLRVNKGDKGELVDFPVEGVFVAIGHDPSTAFLKGFIELDEKGYIVVNGKTIDKNISLQAQTATSVPGVFAAGDCVDSRYRQAIVAAGMGCEAAMDAQHWLDETS